MYFHSDDHHYFYPNRPKFNSSYSFQLLDERMRRKRSELWRRYRTIYLCALFLIFSFTIGFEATRKLVTFLRYKAPFLVQGCFCNEENFCFNGLNKTGHVKYGKPFDCTLYSGLKQLNLLDLNIKESINNDIRSQLKRPIVVTAVDARSYDKLSNFITELGRFYDNSTIVIYDLGMEQKQIDQLKSQWCEIVYTQINQTNHKKNDHQLFGTESLVLIDAFTQYHSFVYLQIGVKIHGQFVDRFVNGTIANEIQPIVPIQMNNNSKASSNELNDFLPIDNRFQRDQGKTIGFFVADSTYTREAFKWIYLCLPTKDCTNFLDPLRNNSLDAVSQILWQFTSTQLFVNKKSPTIPLTDIMINKTIQRYQDKLSKLYHPFLL